MIFDCKNKKMKALTLTAKKFRHHSMKIINENTEDIFTLDGNIINIIPIWKYMLTG